MGMITNPKVLYPLLGVALATGAPAGWLLARALTEGLPSAGGVVSEISTQPWLYAYLTFATAAAFAVFGYLLGAKAEMLEQIAATDHLTGLATRQRLYESLDQVVAEAVRYRRPASLVMADVDRFKQFNDSYGHRMGDAVLRAVARVLVEGKRRPDIVARYGGEEFLLVLPETTPEEAAAFAERLRRLVESMHVSSNGADLSVTASFGVAGGVPTDASWRDRLVEAADQALYDAKRAGRNRVAVRSPH